MSYQDIFVTKTDGSKEKFNPDKIHDFLFKVTGDTTGISVSQVETKLNVQLYNGITTYEITEILIDSLQNLITESTPNYQHVAAIARVSQLRKEVFGQFTPKTIYEVVQDNVKRGVYTDQLLEWYTEEDYQWMENLIKHDRDENFMFIGITQLSNKYLAQDRTTGKHFETPQIMYMLIAATAFHKYPQEERKKWIKICYNLLSLFEFSLPSPIMAGLRTPELQYSSCVLIESGDNLKSINSVAQSIVNYASQKAGIGINGSKIRGIGASVKNGIVKHTGVTPFYRYWQSALKSCSQGGLRGASATLYAPWWHYEIETIMVLKNNKGTDDDRVRKMDYAILRNKLLFQRWQQGKDITLFSPEDVPDLMDAFYADQKEFERLYTAYEKDKSIRKRVISADDWWDTFHTERKETARLYFANIDLINEHGSFRPEIKPVKMSNLCLEITLPTEELGKTARKTVSIPVEDLSSFVKEVNNTNGELIDILASEDGNNMEVEYNENLGRIQLCTLAAINLGKVSDPSDMELTLECIVRMLDEILDYQKYPQPEAEMATKEHRPLGVGVCNLAYFFAKNNLKYGEPEALKRWDELNEAFQYYLIKASNQLAKEKGKCERFNDTKYSLGIMPVDKYKKDVDELVEPVFKMDWDQLRKEVVEHGMRHSVLSAQMPVESSALVLNATNGIEMPRGLVSEKDNSGAMIKQVVPNIHKLKNKYQLLWDQEGCLEYLKTAAVQQKWIDQAISVSTWFNPDNYEDGKIPMSEMIKLDFLMYKWGLKTGYYCYTNDGASDEVSNDVSQEQNNEQETTIAAPSFDDICEGGACAI